MLTNPPVLYDFYYLPWGQRPFSIVKRTFTTRDKALCPSRGLPLWFYNFRMREMKREREREPSVHMMLSVAMFRCCCTVSSVALRLPSPGAEHWNKNLSNYGGNNASSHQLHSTHAHFSSIDLQLPFCPIFHNNANNVLRTELWTFKRF